MRAFIAIALAGLLAVAGPSSAQMTLTGAGGTKKVASGATPLSLDGTPQVAHDGVGPAVSPAFTSTKTNDVIVVTIVTNGVSIISVADTASLSFSRIPSLTPPNAGSPGAIDIWFAIAPSPLSGDVVTVTCAISCFITTVVFAVNGAHTAAPFDVSGPATTVSGPWATLTTTASNTFGIGVGVSGSSSPGSGWTNLAAPALTNFNLTDFQIFSAPQTSNVFDTVGTGVSVTTAIVQGP